MSNPQQPELRRSEQTPSLTPDAIRGELVAHDRPDSDGKTGPVPQANKSGSASGPVQDKPDMDDFAAKFGITDDADRGTGDAGTPDDRAGVNLPKVLAVAASAVGAAVGVVVVLRRRTASRREQIRKHLPV